MNRSNGDATDGAMSWGEWMVKHNYLRVGNGGTGMVGENGARRAMSGANSIGWARINRLESDEEITISALRSRQCRGPWGDAAAPNFEIGISASPTQTRDRTVPCEVRFRVMGQDGELTEDRKVLCEMRPSIGNSNREGRNFHQGGQGSTDWNRTRR